MYLKTTQSPVRPAVSTIQPSTKSTRKTSAVPDARADATIEKNVKAAAQLSGQNRVSARFQSMGDRFVNRSQKGKAPHPLAPLGKETGVIQRFGLQVGGGQAAFALDAEHVGHVSPAVNPNNHIGDLANLGNETLVILGHGIPALGKEPARVDQYDANQFVTLLLGLGYDPENHIGKIDFKSCTSGWERSKDGSFIEQVKALLAIGGYVGQIQGAEGFAVVIPNREIPQNNRVADADEHGNARYQDFGIFRQWRTWNSFLDLVVSRKLHSAARMNSVDDQIDVAKDIDENVKVEVSRQVQELKALHASSPGKFKAGILAVQKAIVKSANFWFDKTVLWVRRGISTREANEDQTYVVESLKPVSAAVSAQIGLYGKDQHYLRPLRGFSNVPAIPEELRFV